MVDPPLTVVKLNHAIWCSVRITARLGAQPQAVGAISKELHPFPFDMPHIHIQRFKSRDRTKTNQVHETPSRHQKILIFIKFHY